ncbi:hypothetical protein B9G98_04187 [Wickerhamiella sorbophila]|uniref:C2 NT-type domain-containing protein n=1 Tax=Wickerhamiella sorbophila TaxID=45607 RepID=A0A2T0FNL2_9ASCO|nr:hypothetical protein B9G98_04187 [Wickerhamiella sorbophila]PRT56567.1 hypothetical protein B9G98_04187 [Wickerhamiella sorbophila]
MSLGDKATFEVYFEVTRVVRMPQNSGNVQVKWRVSNASRPETRGHTDFVDIANNQATFNKQSTFSYRMCMGSETKQLKSGNLVIEVIWALPGMSKVTVGSANLNLAQFVNRKDESISVLLDGSRSNCLVTVKLYLDQKKGPTNYKVPDNTAKIVTSDISTVMDVNKKKKSKFFNPESVEEIKKEYLLHWTATPYHINPINALQEVVAGRDGFAGKAKPVVADPYTEREKNQPYQETDIRESLMSWAYPL